MSNLNESLTTNNEMNNENNSFNDNIDFHLCNEMMDVNIPMLSGQIGSTRSKYLYICIKLFITH